MTERNSAININMRLVIDSLDRSFRDLADGTNDLKERTANVIDGDHLRQGHPLVMRENVAFARSLLRAINDGDNQLLTRLLGRINSSIDEIDNMKSMEYNIQHLREDIPAY